MLNHPAFVEEDWFWELLAGSPSPLPWSKVDWDAEPDWDWSSALNDDAGDLWQGRERSTTRSRELVAEAIARGDLGQGAKKRDEGGTSPTLRWILVYMVEEDARHNDHVDLIREFIDGVGGE